MVKNKIKKYFNIFIEKSGQAVKLFLANDMPLYSANVAFFLIITSIPLFMLIFSTISLVPIVKIDDLIIHINLLFPNLPYVRTVIEYLMGIAKGLATSNIVSTNIIIALITGSNVVYCFIIGIRKIHKIPYGNNFLILRLLAIISMPIFFVAIILMIIFFLLGSMILGYVKKYLPFAVDLIDYILSFRYIVAFVMLLVLMLSLYTTSTNYERKIKHNLYGAITATILWLVISNLFSFYFKTFPLNVSVYGSVSGIVVVLLWLFTCMNIIFLGATINEVIYPESKILEEHKK